MNTSGCISVSRQSMLSIVPLSHFANCLLADSKSPYCSLRLLLAYIGSLSNIALTSEERSFAVASMGLEIFRCALMIVPVP